LKVLVLLAARSALVLGIVCAGFFALNPSWHPTWVAALFELDEIHYEGLANLKAEELDALIRHRFSGNLLSVDLDQLRDLVESESWVRQVTVRRRLPNQIFAHVLERRPAALAAIDNELYLVDDEGMVLDQPGPDHELVDRPIVTGLKSVARENAQEDNFQRVQVYLRLLQELGPYTEGISEIDVEDPKHVAVIPNDDPVHIYLGSENFLARYESFVSQRDLYDRLKREYGVIESVDVTYDNKIIFHTPQEDEGVVSSQEEDNPS